MRFITEDDLREIYKNAPFTTYEPKEGTRLTPGAREFLGDRGIRLYDDVLKTAGFGTHSGSAAGGGTGAHSDSAAGGGTGAHSDSAAGCRTGAHSGPAALRSVQALFLQIGSELLDLDILMAQEVFALERCLGKLSPESSESVQSGPEPACVPCTGIRPENMETCLDDCFEITGFHAQTEKGREIVRLHRLRCALRELEPELPEDRKKRLYRIINRLSQMICLAFGGKTCQKKE